MPEEGGKVRDCVRGGLGGLSLGILGLRNEEKKTVF